MPRPKKRVKLSLSEDESNGKSASNEATDGFKINEEYARRFEHNKKREEKDRLNEKAKRADSEDDTSSSEDEDDAGELVTEALDSEIAATLKALKSKDPSIYDKTKRFYRAIEEDEGSTNAAPKASKPMYLSDYHRQNYLAGNIAGDEEVEEAPPVQTYDQEQEELRRSVVKALHSNDNDDAESPGESGTDDLLVKKTKSVVKNIQDVAVTAPTVLDVENADRDPETFLSNFMSARAWVPDQGSRFANLDEDDSEEEQLAETFEEAYNLRFEDPATANEKMMTYARDAGKYSARREQATGRKQKRDKDREAKDRVKAEREREKARLRNLKIDDIEHKVKQIREAAGIAPTESVDLDEWRAVLDDDEFDDAKWDEVMAKKFGDSYYATRGDHGEDDSDDGETRKQSKKHKKPTWNDDIDVADIAPELHDDSGDSQDGEHAEEQDTAALEAKVEDQPVNPQDQRRAARKQRAAIEALVDNQLVGEDAGSSQNDPVTTGFRYRDTSPGAFGLSTRDILFASDKQLNEFASMKKHHAFRDEQRKRKDRKKLNSRAQRQWRKDVFGTEAGYQGEFADFVREQQAADEPAAASRVSKPGRKPGSGKDEGKSDEGADGEGSKKKKRRHKKAVST